MIYRRDRAPPGRGLPGCLIYIVDYMFTVCILYCTLYFLFFYFSVFFLFGFLYCLYSKFMIYNVQYTFCVVYIFDWNCFDFEFCVGISCKLYGGCVSCAYLYLFVVITSMFSWLEHTAASNPFGSR